MNILFLDLEDTIIEEWDRPFLINVDKIKSFIDNNSFTDFGIFSYAIHNQSDLALFKRDMKPVIEKALGIKFNDKFIWTPSHVQESLIKHKKIAGAEWDDVFIWTDKADGFQIICKYHFRFDSSFNVCHLIDDSVDNSTLKISGLLIKTHNVNGQLI